MSQGVECERYKRQIPLIGEAGQKKLADATVFVAGAGGLGSPVLMYLAEAGVGNIRLADCDVVEMSNLNRQILHPQASIGRPKAESAKETILSLNPKCNVSAFSEKINDESIARLAMGASLIIDCMDNFETRYVLNRYSLKKGVPFLHGAVEGYCGQVSLFIPGVTPCLSCVFPRVEGRNFPAVLGPYAGVVGCLEAAEAIKYLTGEPSLAGKLLIYDGKSNAIDVVTVKKNPKCDVCRGK